MTETGRPTRYSRRPLFEETEETTTVAGIRDGDFVVRIESYRNVRGVRVDSGVALIEDDNTWVERGGYRRSPAIPIAARRLRVHRGGTVLSYPASAPAVVRRRLPSA